jgi:hypothetical protein
VRGGVTNCFKCEGFPPSGPCYTYTGEGASREYTAVPPDITCSGVSTEIVSGKYREAIRILPEPPSSAACTNPRGGVCGYMLGCSASGICSGS